MPYMPISWDGFGGQWGRIYGIRGVSGYTRLDPLDPLITYSLQTVCGHLSSSSPSPQYQPPDVPGERDPSTQHPGATGRQVCTARDPGLPSHRPRSAGPSRAPNLGSLWIHCHLLRRYLGPPSLHKWSKSPMPFSEGMWIHRGI